MTSTEGIDVKHVVNTECGYTRWASCRAVLIGCVLLGLTTEAVRGGPTTAPASAPATAPATVPATTSAAASAPASQPERPNVILICLDGLSAGVSSQDGHPVAKTPNIDRLAAQGVRFTRAYTSIPQAQASRIAMLTGQYPHVNGVMNDKTQLSRWAITFSATLAKSGYACGLVGDWRLPEPPADPNAPAQPTPPVTPVPPGRPGLPTPSPSMPPRPLNPITRGHPPETPLPSMVPQGNQPPSPPGHGIQFRPATRPGTQPAGQSATQPATQPGSQPASQPSTQAATRPSMQPFTQPAAVALTPPAQPPVVPPAIPAPTPPAPPPVKLPGKPGLGFDGYYAAADPGAPLQNATAMLNGEQVKVDGYLPDWYTERANDFIRRSKGKPFCLCVFYPGMREPMAYPPGMESAYPADRLPLPTIKQADAKTTASLQTTEMWRNSPKQAQQLREKQAKYFATLARLDENVGRLLATLDELKLSENTTIVFTSSQGFSTGENGLWGSGPVFWNTFIHCPLVVRAARMNAGAATATASAPAGVEVSQPVSLVDIAPTLIEAAGLPVPISMQGRSLLPLLGDRHDADRPEETFIEYESQNNQQFPARAVLAGQFKLVDYLQSADQFFDLKRDPKEEHNVADEPAYAGVVKVMRARLDTWRKRTKDPTAPR